MHIDMLLCLYEPSKTLTYLVGPDAYMYYPEYLSLAIILEP